MMNLRRTETGFSLSELVVVMAGAFVLLGMSVPVFNVVSTQYRFVMAAQSIASQLHYARLKAVTSNEEFRVNFLSSPERYQVESSTGSIIAGPFYLPIGVSGNTTCSGTGVSFPGSYVSFLPTGNIPTTGNGSAGRARIINTAGNKIDIVVSSGGIIRQTPAYTGCTPAF